MRYQRTKINLPKKDYLYFFKLIKKYLFSSEKNIILNLLIDNFTNYERYIINWFMWAI